MILPQKTDPRRATKASLLLDSLFNWENVILAEKMAFYWELLLCIASIGIGIDGWMIVRKDEL